MTEIKEPSIWVGEAPPEGASADDFWFDISATPALNLAVNVVGSIASGVPGTPGYQRGDAVVAADTKRLWVWSGAEWVDVGSFSGPTGPAGPAGPEGPEGPAGATPALSGGGGTSVSVDEQGNPRIDVVPGDGVRIVDGGVGVDPEWLAAQIGERAPNVEAGLGLVGVEDGGTALLSVNAGPGIRLDGGLVQVDPSFIAKFSEPRAGLTASRVGDSARYLEVRPGVGISVDGLGVHVNEMWVAQVVHNVVQGNYYLTPVRAASTEPIDLTFSDRRVDGVWINAGDRILIKDQADPSENGLYLYDDDGLVRTSDTEDLRPGVRVRVGEGAVQADTMWSVDPGLATWSQANRLAGPASVYRERIPGGSGTGPFPIQHHLGNRWVSIVVYEEDSGNEFAATTSCADENFAWVTMSEFTPSALMVVVYG